MSAAARPRRRDPERARAKILAAAIAEFSARGFSGARTARIARRARVNVRMLYHYYGGKDALYVAVLEAGYERLRHDELQLDIAHTAPLDGLLALYAFIDGHFATHPELRGLFAYENLNRARHLRRSTRIPEMSSPVIALVEELIARGRADGSFRDDIDALRLYIAMVSLSYYSKSHAHTLSRIFGTDLLAPQWQAAQAADVRRMLTTFVAADAAAAASRSSARRRAGG
ncbi:MAG: TetR family transcriptional regulator [Burkholderiales bacterium]|nr:TetR family transcriptional regulator [Burkholderiales bacterium]